MLEGSGRLCVALQCSAVHSQPVDGICNLHLPLRDGVMAVARYGTTRHRTTRIENSVTTTTTTTTTTTKYAGESFRFHSAHLRVIGATALLDWAG
eukprot:jgi/Psemu1/308024/fgenesh1_kg.373_\